MNTSMEKKVVESESGQGQMKRIVETVDYRTPAGKRQEQKVVKVIHKPHTASKTSGGVLANAAAAVSTTLESAKQAISRN